MRKFALLAASLVALFGASVEYNGKTLEFEKAPEKVLVLDDATLDNMLNLGISDKVVGLPKENVMPSFLEGYKDAKFANAGGIKELNIEAIYAMKPDLIIFSGRQIDYKEQLEKIAPNVMIEFDWKTNYMAALEKNLNFLTQIYGQVEIAKEKIAQINERISALKAKATGKTALVLMVNNRNIKVLGPGSRFSLISEVGFENIGAADSKDSIHGESASYEYILKQNPDFIFVLDRNAITKAQVPGAKEQFENSIVTKTDAYKNGKISYLNPEAWYLSEGGISATSAMLDDIENILK